MRRPRRNTRTCASRRCPPWRNRRRSRRGCCRFCWKTWGSIRRCKAILREFGADAVLGMGGFTSLPPVYAGHKLGLKTFIHDSNARPGPRQRADQPFLHAGVSRAGGGEGVFPEARNRDHRHAGPPGNHRPAVARGGRQRASGSIRKRPTILVTGGSQGARRLNELSAEAAAKLPPETQVLHIAGALDFERVSEIARGRPGYKVLGFCDRMPAAYAVADLVDRALRRIEPHRDRDFRASVDPRAVSLSPRTTTRRATPRFSPNAGAARARPGTRSRSGKTRLAGHFHPPGLANLQAHGKSRPRTRHPGRRGAGVRRHRSHSHAIMTDLSQRLTDRSKPLQIHLIGVAGSGMSGLALLLLGMGHKVSGSDRVTTAETERMQGRRPAFSRRPTPRSRSTARTSSCIRPRSSRTIRPTPRPSPPKIPLFRRAECLAAILHTRKRHRDFRHPRENHHLRDDRPRPARGRPQAEPLRRRGNPDPRREREVVRGRRIHGRGRRRKRRHARALSARSTRSSSTSRPSTSISTATSTTSARSSPRSPSRPRGKLVYCAEDPVAHELCGGRENAVSYGWEDADYTATDIRDLKGSSAFTVMKHGAPLGDIELGIPGNHNILNALAAIALADSCGAEFPHIARALSTFAGAKRRFETKYLSPNYRIVDDYGHHPSEIAATCRPPARSSRSGSSCCSSRTATRAPRRSPRISEKSCKPPIWFSSPMSIRPPKNPSRASPARRSSMR